MELLISIAFIYSIGFLSLTVINAFIAGYTNTQLSRQDLFESLLWPLTIVMLLGTISHAILKYLKRVKE